MMHLQGFFGKAFVPPCFITIFYKEGPRAHALTLHWAATIFYSVVIYVFLVEMRKLLPVVCYYKRLTLFQLKEEGKSLLGASLSDNGQMGYVGGGP
ncbi:hypothetical protein NPIL_502591 [Nephila pilipes]|uniref:Uncharacterized protein n=1 Tax=Nephila pilipes TaxID=299642 RepID=A0A8X6K7B7_NEPPI|nr:hypothetical protein NPIL_502591 [Nephila pilipes]